jgi:hypothetical protein
MRDLVAQTGLNVLLSALYEDTVISTFQEFGLDARELNFGRGRPMPLFRIATSKVILAHLPPRCLRRLHDAHADGADLRALGADWRTFSRAMLFLARCLPCGARAGANPTASSILTRPAWPPPSWTTPAACSAASPWSAPANASPPFRPDLGAACCRLLLNWTVGSSVDWSVDWLVGRPEGRIVNHSCTP